MQQQQVMKRNMSSEMGWGNGGEGGWGQQSSTLGSGSWTSTANQDTSSTWQAMGKSDNASDAGDDASSVKSGSTITNASNITPQQSQDSVITSSSSSQPSSSSSPWSANPTLSGMDSSPWGTRNSPAPSGIGSLGWNNSNPSSLSLANNQGLNTSMQPGTSIIGSNASFNSTSSASSSSGWPSGMTGSNQATSSTLSQNTTSSGLQAGSFNSQWGSGPILGNIDFPKSTDSSSWNTSATSGLDSKDPSANSADPRLWGVPSDKGSDQNWDPSKSNWGATSMPSASGDQVSSNSPDMSFAQATLKGLKVPSAASAPQNPMQARHEEILRAIENHEGWGSRPIRQDTSWDIESSPKSHSKFAAESNSGASNVWNNSNGTAIWESVRENQSGWGGGGAAGGNWNQDKDPSGWGPPKPSQDSSSWGVGSNSNGADPKAFGTWGGAPGSGAGDASNKMWNQNQKTDFGSWGDTSAPRSASISSWGDDGEPGSGVTGSGGWEDPRRITGAIQGMVPPSPGINGPTNMPGMMPQGMPGMNMPNMGSDATPWNDANQKHGWNGGLGRAKMDEPWNKPPPKMSGWGDPTQDGVKVDDGTSIWASSAQKPQMPPQGKAPGWGDSSPQGQWNVGAKPKMPGWDEASWAMAQRAKQMPPKHMGNSGGNNPATQMRAKLLQQLMDLGFRKDEAQNALITNNMNLEMAVNDLKNNGMQRKDLDDVFQANGSQNRMPYMPKGLDDLSDNRPDQVPNFSTVQNTPFPNAQAPNQPFMQSNPSLPPSSLTTPNPSINPSLQQKLIHKMQQVPPTNNVGPRGQLPPVGSAGSNQVPQQQQQQILAQLRQAISNGFISPQLLNYQLPHNILVLLQQLLQLQTARQSMMNKLQQARINPGQNRSNQQQLEHIVNNINQQINNLQKQLQQAQNNLFSSQKLPNMSQQPPTSGMMTPLPGQQPSGTIVDSMDALSNDIANVAMSQSRLTTQWKPMGDASGSDNLAISSSSSTPGSEDIDKSSKGLLQTSSSNLNLIPGGLNMTRDQTWSSTTSSSNWPNSSSTETSASTSSLATGEGKTSSNSTSSILSGITDVIPEFVPGKPWQGLTTKSVEDDPHATPGGIQRSLSVNRVHDESLSNLDGSKLNSANWTNSGKNDNSLGLSQLGTRPPPSMMPNKMVGGGSQQWQSGGVPFNRQASWAGRSSAFTQVASNNWNDGQLSSTTWVLLKNLTSLDSATVRALCQQHGALNNFFAQGQAALVQYVSRDVAFSAVQRLNNFQVGNTIIAAELISESDAQRVASQIPPPQPASSAMPPNMGSSQWSQAPPTLYQGGARAGGNDPWGSSNQSMSKFASSGGDPWGGSGLWGDMSSMADHNSNPLLSNILGGESM